MNIFDTCETEPDNTEDQQEAITQAELLREQLDDEGDDFEDYGSLSHGC